MREQETNIHQADKIKAFLERSSAGFTSQKQVSQYCGEGMDLGFSVIKDKLNAQFPGRKDDVAAELAEIKSISGQIPPTDLLVVKNEIVIRYKERYFKTNPLMQAIYYADPNVGSFSYLRHFLPNRHDTQQEEKTHHAFTKRFEILLKEGKLTPDSNLACFFALMYTSQVGQDLQIESAHNLIRKATGFSRLIGEEYLPNFFNSLKPYVVKIKDHEAYVRQSNASYEELAAKMHLDSEKTRLLSDLALLKDKVFLNPHKYQEAIKPILERVQSGKWQDAFSHRNFLLEYASDLFKTRSEIKLPETGFSLLPDSAQDLINRSVQKQRLKTYIKIPEGYRQYALNIPPETKPIKELPREKDFALKSSLLLSNKILNFLIEYHSAVELEKGQLVYESNHYDALHERFDKRNFSLLLYKTIEDSVTKKDSIFTWDKEDLKMSLVKAYSEEKKKNPYFTLSLTEYLDLVITNLKGELTPDNPVKGFITDIAKSSEEI